MKHKQAVEFVEHLETLIKELISDQYDAEHELSRMTRSPVPQIMAELADLLTDK